jgi:hypothetical protein
MGIKEPERTNGERTDGRKERMGGERERERKDGK